MNDRFRQLRRQLRRQRLVAAILVAAAATNSPHATASGPGTEFVLLGNGQVLRGELTDANANWIIRRGGGEIRLPKRRVLHHADSLVALHQFRIGQYRYPTTDMRLTEARWCMDHGLFAEALAECDLAARVDPTHPQLPRLRALIQSARDHAGAPATIRPVGFESPTEVRTDGAADRPDPAGPNGDPTTFGNADTAHPEPQIDPVATQNFVRTIQPLLLNRCARCHARSDEVTFRLIQPVGRRRATRRVTNTNLAATLRFIEEGSLIDYAETAHGGANDPPLGQRQARASQSLRDWVASVRVTAPRESSTPPNLREIGDEQPAAGQSDGSTTFHSSRTDQPRRLPTVKNPFDPKIFNRMH